MKVSEKSGSGPKIPEGMHEACCVGLYDLGNQDQAGQFPGTYHKLMLLWETESGDIIGKEYTASLGEKANLRKDLQMWRGRPFAAEELSGFDLSKVLGVHCVLQIIHVKDWARINAILPSKGTWEPKSAKINFDINDLIPTDTPSWIVKKINASHERRNGEQSQDGKPQADGTGIPADGGDVPW